LSPISTTQLDRGLYQRFENGLEIEGRAADDLEHVGGGGLLRNRLVKPTLEINNDLLGIVGNVIRHNEYSKISGETLGATSISLLIYQSMTA
jgi:hypothetical protein